MALDITHSTVVVTPDDGSSEVGSDEWNDTHTISGTLPAANLEPAGSDTQVQFNDGGAFGGDSGLVYNKATNALTVGALLSGADDGGALGASGTAFSDLFLAAGGVINWNAGAVTITETSDVLAFAGGQSYTFDEEITPDASDGAALGTSSLMWSDLFLASAGVINWDNGAYTATQASAKLTLSSTTAADTELAIGSSGSLLGEASNVLALRNSTSAQVFRVYNTFTNSLNYERGVFTWSATANVFRIQTENAGTGAARDLYIVSAGSTLRLGTGGNSSTGWQVASGHLVPSGSGAHLGQASSVITEAYINRVRTPAAGELTIASGAITVTGSFHDVDTQADDATDDLDTINGGVNGARLILRTNNAARTVVVKDGTGNIQCAGDFSLDNTQDTIELIFDSTLSAWLEIGRSDNGA